MRTTLLTLLFAISLSGCSRANSVLIVDIVTSDTGIRYTMNNQPKAPAEIESWLREAIRQFGDGDPVLIRPDGRTSFQTVFDMLQRFKAAGVKHFQVIAASETVGGVSIHKSLSGTADNMQSERLATSPPPQ